ncbi:E3 ubiquitin-protein ligase RGLG1 (RING domain ligase 1) [Durusdinium trenchii]|uniref:E3 ubiquitin-protein ligase RGLG1 (RING domain ligase 1) n=1 Tax=Durusdinium trenchii TaxID=1381693 RepID=A0ABP0JN51_9DINO
MGNVIAAFGEEGLKLFPFAIAVSVLIYAAVRLIFGSCDEFVYQLRSECRECLGYPALPLRESQEVREVVRGMPHGLMQAFLEILPLPTAWDIPASTAEPANGGPTCPVCILNWPNAALDCGHRICAACLSEIRGRSNCCPVCRDPIRRVVRLYN